MGNGRRQRSSGASRFVLLGVFTALIIGSLISTATPAAASGISVYVGYADSGHTDPHTFPAPWSGSPQTTFLGCQPPADCVFDSGGVRVVNTSSSPLTVDAIAIHVSTCTFTGWPSAVIAPGAEVIATQMAPTIAVSCGGTANVDTSDIGPGGINYAGHCTPDGILPVVDVTINGTTTSYTDSGQVLNTGGFDKGGCVGSEATQWTLIGSNPCPSSALTLAPAQQDRAVGTTATVSATFTNSCGQPLSNALVQFAVTAGPNAGRSGSGITNANGVATFTYSSLLTGTDTTRATITNPAGTITSNTVSVTWTPGFAQGGGFVIGDLENVPGGSAYWWGAQWWKKDQLSTGLAPASFKGFENSNPTPWCGQSWTTRPGNSSRPPTSVPNTMAVIVASHITKSGPMISGNVVDIVLVKTDPGYGPNPGHPGTGTIIATLCSNPSSAGVVKVDAGGAELHQLDGVAGKTVGAGAVGRSGLSRTGDGGIPVRGRAAHGVAANDRRPHGLGRIDSNR